MNKIISISPAARGKNYYKIQIDETRCIDLKLDPDPTQEQIDTLVTELLEQEAFEEQRLLQEQLNNQVPDGDV